MSKHKSETEEKDFTNQMEELVAEAEQIEQFKGKASVGLLQLLRPLVLGIEALSRATAENNQKIDHLQESVGAQAAVPSLLSNMQKQFEQKGVVNQKLFDALHDELRGYKDNFLLDILQKPIIRDLITLYDDFSEMHRRLDLFSRQNNNSQPTVNEFLRHLAMSLDNAVSSVVEILARLDVIRMEASSGKLDKQQHRAVAVVEAASQEENGDIIQSLKPCFVWRGRIFRPEEVIIKKWSGPI
ncbi:MAG: nucleotide exchange factor GrpE [Verrucomicrobiota bacterium]